ncbi:hypothetical protein [Synechococcus sp. UW179A]|uniref:hypothetical protein n=1 Tax=Synechococcus sp. UW179A TaxID=2575510 RepID=UPI000E0E7C29|nr:hypothetical protein [Synechococcus sp. UW179A]
MKKQFLTTTILALTQLTLLFYTLDSKSASIERYELKTDAIKACINWLRNGTKYTFHDDGTWLEDNNRICVDGRKNYDSTNITGMEDPSIEPKNYDDIPNPVKMKIIKFFDYREDDGTSLDQ